MPRPTGEKRSGGMAARNLLRRAATGSPSLSPQAPLLVLEAGASAPPLRSVQTPTARLPVLTRIKPASPAVVFSTAALLSTWFPSPPCVAPEPLTLALAAGVSAASGLRHYAAPSSVEEAVGNLELHEPKANRRSNIPKKNGTAMMLPLHFHYEDVLRQDLLLKQNHANIMQVPGLFDIKLAPKAGSDLKIPIGKMAMEVLSGQRFKEAKSDPFAKARKSSRNNPFIGADKDGSTAFAQPTVLRGHAMYNFLVRMLTVMSMLDSRAEIRENTIKFFMETEFCEFSPELEDHFEIFEQIRGFNVTIVTSADTKDETSLLWSGFTLNDEGETK